MRVHKAEVESIVRRLDQMAGALRLLISRPDLMRDTVREIFDECRTPQGEGHMFCVRMDGIVTEDENGE